MATVLHFLSIGDGSSYELHNLPFAYRIDVTEQDYTLWEPFEFEFCGQVSWILKGLYLHELLCTKQSAL